MSSEEKENLVIEEHSSKSTNPNTNTSSSTSHSRLVRVSSREILKSAAMELNRLTPSNSQRQTSALCRTSSVILLVIVCLLVGTDLLGKRVASTRSNNNNDDFNMIPANSNKDASSPDIEQQKSSKSKNGDDDSSNSKFPQPYSLDLSDYWSQPKEYLFNFFQRTPEKVKPQSLGIYSENFVKERNLKESEIFKCYYGGDDAETIMNDEWEIVPPSSSSSKTTTVTDAAKTIPTTSNGNKQDDDDFLSSRLTKLYFEAPRIVSKKQQQRTKSEQQEPFYRYDVILFPVGCFGDVAVTRRGGGGGRGGVGSGGNNCDGRNGCCSTSCKALDALVKFVPCGKRPIGLVLGDNFYPNGIVRRNDPRLDLDFNSKFLFHKLFRFPWFGTVGNHDLKPHHQFRFSNSSLWVMPRAHHATPHVTFPSRRNPQRDGDGDGDNTQLISLQVFFVSTQWGYDNNGPHMAEEARWLDTALSESKADIKIVASHEPIYGFLGFEHSRPLIKHIEPVLKRHGVPLWIAAHTHSIHFHRTPAGYYQLVSAGFADNLHSGVRYGRPRGHFYIGRGATAVAVNASHIVVTAFDLEGRHVFHFAFDWRMVIKDVKRSISSNTVTRPVSKEVGTTSSRDVSGGDDDNGQKNDDAADIWTWAKTCNKAEPKMNAFWC